MIFPHAGPRGRAPSGSLRNRAIEGLATRLLLEPSGWTQLIADRIGGPSTVVETDVDCSYPSGVIE